MMMMILVNDNTVGKILYLYYLAERSSVGCGGILVVRLAKSYKVKPCVLAYGQNGSGSFFCLHFT